MAAINVRFDYMVITRAVFVPANRVYQKVYCHWRNAQMTAEVNRLPTETYETPTLVSEGQLLVCWLECKVTS